MSDDGIFMDKLPDEIVDHIHLILHKTNMKQVHNELLGVAEEASHFRTPFYDYWTDLQQQLEICRMVRSGRLVVMD